MKKQILTLTFLTLAILFAGMNKSYGQVQLPASEATLTPLSCVSNASPLHPVSGVPYTYRMDGSTGTELADQWTWWATKDSSFISSGGLNMTNMLTVSDGQLLGISENYGDAGNADTVSITWTSEILSNTKYQAKASITAFPSPTFVVGYATGTNCADNIEVYEINPITAFYIDIANIDGTYSPMAWDADTSQCVSPVVSATYDSPTDSIMMDYGTDTLYFEIAAAGFVTSWTPTFTFQNGLSESQTATIGLATSLANAQAGTFISDGDTTITASAIGDGWTGPVLTATNSSDISKGVSVWARVVIDNNTYESLSAQAFTLAVDAQDATGQWDMEDSNCSDPSSATDDQVDKATHIINPRPTIIDATSDDENVEPNTFIDKQED